jgi:outer membrane protein assembly factor BamD (BamD/ComL family)
VYAIHKDYLKDGHPKYAANTLQELLEQFPDSQAADEAKQLLGEIGEGGNSE